LHSDRNYNRKALSILVAIVAVKGKEAITISCNSLYYVVSNSGPINDRKY